MGFRSWRVSVGLLVVAVLGLAGPVGADDASTGWYVVEYGARISQADRERLTELGEALQYAGDNSYVAWLTAAAAEQAPGLEGVSSVRPLRVVEKVHAGIEQAGYRDAVLASVYDAAAPEARTLLARRWGVRGEFPAAGGLRNLIVDAPVTSATSVAALAEVLYVGPVPGGLVPLDEVGDQIVAGNLRGSVVTPGYETWLSEHKLDGAGVRVAVVDTGIDNHPDFGSRIVGRVNMSQLPSGEPNDIGGHGTHVAGIVGGNPANLPGIGRVTDSQNFLYGLGVAPAVGLVDINAIAITSGSFFCSGGWTPRGGWKTLPQGALKHGASIWNASWRTCEGAGIGYADSSRSLDALVRDGDPDSPGNQPFTMVFAAGNAGGPSQRIEAPSEAKNTIVVGASVNRGNPNTMAGFSSRGPAKDGRVFPTVSAPGDDVVSTRPFAGVACSTPVLDSYTLYSMCSGTSMASPHVAGSVALVTQWWRRAHDGVDPSPAMSKALLVNTATDMGMTDIPNKDEGWGRVNLGELFDPNAQRITQDQQLVLTELDQEHTLQVRVADPTKPLRTTVVWTDVPAHAGAAPALVNDLDLEVRDEGGAVYPGNRFRRGVSVSRGAPDRINNVENVFIREAAGTYTVTVRAVNLPDDGVPGTGDETDQDFALVISNAQLAG